MCYNNVWALFIYFFLIFSHVTDELDSYMYQTVGHQAIELYADAMDLPLYGRIIQGSSLDTSRNYRETEGDEVEDLYQLLHLVKVVYKKYLLPRVSGLTHGNTHGPMCQSYCPLRSSFPGQNTLTLKEHMFFLLLLFIHIVPRVFLYFRK